MGFNSASEQKKNEIKNTSSSSNTGMQSKLFPKVDPTALDVKQPPPNQYRKQQAHQTQPSWS